MSCCMSLSKAIEELSMVPHCKMSHSVKQQPANSANSIYQTPRRPRTAYMPQYVVTPQSSTSQRQTSHNTKYARMQQEIDIMAADITGFSTPESRIKTVKRAHISVQTPSRQAMKSIPMFSHDQHKAKRQKQNVVMPEALQKQFEENSTAALHVLKAKRKDAQA